MAEEPITTIVMNWEEFCEKYRPIPNSIDRNASYDGYMWETFGDELVHVLEAARYKGNTVWTIICEDPVGFIANGYWLINRLGYIITEVPYLDGQDIIADRITSIYNEKGELTGVVEG